MAADALPPVEAVVDLARRAGQVVLEIYNSFDGASLRKEDGSPVTAADHAAEALILPGLRALLPGVPVVAEEHCAAHGIPAAADRFWLVDPVDGTKEFLRRNGEFTVNIALVVSGLPVLGVVEAPAFDRRFWAAGGEAWQQQGDETPRRIMVRPPPADGLVVLTSRSHRDDSRLDDALRDRHVAERRILGSSLKIALIAAGEADLYLRFGPTMEWDTAAADAVLRAAGGVIDDASSGHPLAYAKPGFANSGFVAHGAAAG
ncbi:3'(2'),5'-bisphosphate nucleotidase CysQ [Mycobacterium sp. KBS0706]|uniref:3'(2'),5'-bisphosphate nucleotidase CysQ n=1 Tax=Mycobacterium sp. KBS0706 TaxID=2578109 RepID=UPI00110F894D|nr:3'(2'),5'-bisphosphate nucleotidase CysQ [Mycobacterium sp. KBS0706]TSD83542.1 3'(2'),5'-bisphosphate nucleotidase CysQ [Mycobacterium sp. KBS0706]